MTVWEEINAKEYESFETQSWNEFYTQEREWPYTCLSTSHFDRFPLSDWQTGYFEVLTFVGPDGMVKELDVSVWECSHGSDGRGRPGDRYGDRREQELWSQ